MPLPELAAVISVARSTPGLDLLMLYGSRARGDAGPGADWDFGFLAQDGMDLSGFLAALVETLGDDRVDLADLRAASGLLRYRAAREGQVLFEAKRGNGERFCFEATRFWCEAGPMLERGYSDLLEALPR